MVRHFLRDTDLSPAEQASVLDDAAVRKSGPRPDPDAPYAGCSVVLVMEKSSTRTRVSFDVGVYELGGHPLTLTGASSQLGRGESPEDTARVLSRMAAALVVRTTTQDRLERMASVSRVPVVNALTDSFHPCQLLADLLTVRERRGVLAGLSAAYLGDGSNNMAASWLLAGATAGMHVRVGAPAAYAPAADVLCAAAERAALTGGSVAVVCDPLEAARGADVLATDVFASMGSESQAGERLAALASYRVDDALVSVASPEAVVLHCLPAHRGEEITADVLDGPQSAVWDEAENRLHAQKALLAFLRAETPA